MLAVRIHDRPNARGKTMVILQGSKNQDFLWLDTFVRDSLFSGDFTSGISSLSSCAHSRDLVITGS
jgi:hypothetical protein